MKKMMAEKIVVTTLPIILTVISGCRILEPRDRFDALDGNAGAVTTEIVAMGASTEDLMSAGGAETQRAMAKAGVMAAETMYVDVIVNGWTYDSALKCWTRASQARFANGTRVRKDTVWLMNAAGDTVQTPGFGTVARYRHVRAVNTTAGNTFDNRLDMTVNIVIGGGDTTFVKNGTITGSYNGSLYRTTTVTNVTRRWHGSRPAGQRLAFPSDGTVSIDLPLRTITIIFDGDGNGTATATATRKRDGESVVYVINVQTGAESET